MIKGKKVIGLIPARGGSKEIPRKNVICVAGKPLIAYSIESAHKSKYLDDVIVSTDDREILDISQNLGAAVIKRPPELASDTAPVISTVLHTIDLFPGSDLIILLQPTSPLRLATDIDEALEFFLRHEAMSCVSVRSATENPFWMYTISKRNELSPVVDSPIPVRRQDSPKIFIINGAIYLADVGWLRNSKRFIDEKTIAFIMPTGRSLDIDSWEDLNRFKEIVDGR